MLLDYRVLEREYLLAISRALTAELDLSDVLRIIVRAAVELVSGRAGIIALANPIDETFRVAAVYGIPPEHISRFDPLLQGLPYGEGREHEAIPELTRRMQELAREADLGLTQVIRLPMISGDSVVGMIYVFQTGSYRFRSDASNLLRSFADQAAIAVKNARLYEAVIAEKQRLDAILEQSADGVMILDPHLEITVFNNALSRMTGWEADRAIGRIHDEVIRWRSLETDMDLAVALANGWPLPHAAHLYVEGELERKDRSIISLGITYAPLLDSNGRMTDIIANVRDLTRYREEQELQKTFVSVISHELKTPVSIIKGYAGTLRRQQEANWPPEVLDEYHAVIEEEADQLTELIDRLLEASRLQAGTFKLELDEVWLPKLASSVARKFAGQASNHHIEVDFPEDFPMVRGDERRLTQVLNNLVSNAIKYSPAGTDIDINGTVQSNYVMVSVRDEGIGIPQHEEHRIFEKFSRLDNALSRKTEGTGLGLFLTKAIVEAHGGRIWFNSNRDAKGNGSGAKELPGTTFTFCLPRDGRLENSNE
ncbi:MAG TPA: ATP-binding protein [Candidatus Binatia bacterium]|nr:ATP-binding protein [Candidatus Binatia bacterium]